MFYLSLVTWINTLLVRQDVCVITPTHISSTMRPSSAYRSPKIPGAWLAIDTTDGRSPRVSSRPYSTLSQIENDARSFPRPGILPQKYDKSERLHLELWDPHRLAAHVMATLSPEDERAAAVDFILENKISGAFLAHYTYDIDAIFPDAIENTEIIRLIAQTIPHIFWIKPCEPPTLRCNLREIVKEIRASKTNPIYTSTTKHARPSLVSDWGESLMFNRDYYFACSGRKNQQNRKKSKLNWLPWIPSMLPAMHVMGRPPAMPVVALNPEHVAPGCGLGCAVLFAFPDPLSRIGVRHSLLSRN